MREMILGVLRGCGRLLSARDVVAGPRLVHTTCSALASRLDPEEVEGGHNWLLRNEKVFPPQAPGEEPRPAFVCHMRSNVRGNYKNMWYQAGFIRGMSIDEALKQLSFQRKGFCATIKEVLLEAQQLALRDHGVEFKSDLWIAESFVSKGQHFKGLRRHARMRMGEVRYQYNHYYVRLQQGPPPEHRFKPKPTGEEMLQKWIQKMRDRHVQISI
ncbi:large ribosomal subunit protein uL22m [Neocloeon triangulifer]|uniref:large ribosomal subunit protein uL22m n=1 Tax=Neocloeon triangulifer TaxID=2078957 RepID=UPI00286F7B1A|nr:large ribosomal subunit protein uL22m [Neocloeon triangulifer]